MRFNKAPFVGDKELNLAPHKLKVGPDGNGCKSCQPLVGNVGVPGKPKKGKRLSHRIVRRARKQLVPVYVMDVFNDVEGAHEEEFMDICSELFVGDREYWDELDMLDYVPEYCSNCGIALYDDESCLCYNCYEQQQLCEVYASLTFADY